MKNWLLIENSSARICVLVLIIFIGVYLRLNHLELCTYNIFIDRDCYRSSNMLKGYTIPPLGPELVGRNIKARTVGNFTYLLNSIPLISYKHPISVAWFTTVLNILAIFLFFMFVKRYFGSIAAFISSLFFIVSPIMISFSRTPWHSSMMTPFIILYYYCLFDLIINNNSVNFIALLILWGLLFQLHFIAIFILPAFFISIIIFKPQIYLRYIIVGIIALCSLFLPYLLYEISHNFVNTKLILEAFLSANGSGKMVEIINLHTINFFFRSLFPGLKDYLEDYSGWLGQYYLFYLLMLIGALNLTLFSFGIFSYIKQRSKEKTLLLLSIFMPILIMSFLNFDKLNGLKIRYFSIIFPLLYIIMSLGFIKAYEIIKDCGTRLKNILSSLLVSILFLSVIVYSVYCYRTFNCESLLKDSEKLGCIKTASRLAKILACDLKINDNFLMTRIMTKSETKDFFEKNEIGYIFLFYKLINKSQKKELDQDDYIVVAPKDYDINRLLTISKNHIYIKKIIEDDYFKLVIYKDNATKIKLQSYLDGYIYNYYVFSKDKLNN